jgi:hypothetical protein
MTSLSVESPYSQAPLDLSGATFRLVELQPCGPTDLIKCRVTAHALPPDCPSFVALSYMWDHISPKDKIELNGIPFLVGHSLWTFLDEMRSQGRFRTYWIDAVCIDQSNVQERNHQVQLMKVIYSEAESVSIWLGPAEEGSLCIEAMKYLKDLDRHPQLRKGYQNLTWAEKHTILAICRIEYWERMWILQEVVLAHEVTMCYGAWTVRFRTFQAIIKISAHGTSHDDKRALIGLAYDVCHCRKEFNKRARLSLTLALSYSKPRKATDVRDRIFGLLGLADVDAASIKVDYQIPVLDLWKMTSAHLCRDWADRSRIWVCVVVSEAETVAQVLDLDVSQEMMMSFIETQAALYEDLLENFCTWGETCKYGRRFGQYDTCM